MLNRNGFWTFRNASCLVPKRSLSQLNNRDNLPTPPAQSPSAPSPSSNPFHGMEHTYRVTNFDKRCLVISGHYPSFNDVPREVTQARMEKCRNIIRVRGTMLIMVIGSIGAYCAVTAGRDEVHRITAEVEKFKEDQSK